MATFPLNNERNLVKRASRFAEVDRSGWKLPAFLLLVSFLVVIVEFVWSPIEFALGNYMSWTNGVRPAVGTGWELDQEQAEADRELGQLVEEVDQRQYAAASFTDWEKLPDLIRQHGALSISTGRFLELYAALPSFMRHVIIDPVDLLRIRSEGRWQRVIFRNEHIGIRVYFVNQQNFALSSATLGQLFFEQLSDYHAPVPGSLDDNTTYMGRVFAADVFFTAIREIRSRNQFSLPGDWVANLDGRLSRVGVSKEVVEGKRALGFEVDQAGSLKTYTIWIDDQVASELFSGMMDLSLFQEGGR